MNFTSRIQIIQKYIEKEKGKKEIFSNDFTIAKKNLQQNKIKLKNIQKAQLIIQHVAQQTQEELEYYLSNIVSLALNSVFDDPYEFKIDFIIKRGTTEAEIYFMRDGEKYKPMDTSGFGPIDVASFALRLAVLQLNKKHRRTIILDEPFRFISKNYLPKVADMIKELSKKLKIQIIIVTHIKELESCADKLFEVNINKKISQVKEL